MFNQHGIVFIGGRKDATGRLVKSFHGIIAGLMLNGLWLLELAADGDARFRLEGEVELSVTALKIQQQKRLRTELPKSSLEEQQTTAPESLHWTRQSTSDFDSKASEEEEEEPGEEEEEEAEEEDDGVNYDDCFDLRSEGKPEGDCRKHLLETDVNSSPAEKFTRNSPLDDSTVAGDVEGASSSVSLAALAGRRKPVFETNEPCSSEDEDCEEQASSGHRQLSPSSSPAPLPFDRVEVLRLKDTKDHQAKNSVTVRWSVVTNPVQDHVVGSRGSDAVNRRTPDWIDLASNGRTTLLHGNEEAHVTRAPPTSRLKVFERVPPGSETNHLDAAERDGEGGTSTGTDERTSSRSASSSAFGMNIGLIVGIATGVVLLALVLSYAAFKYRNQGEGSYKLDGTDRYGFDAYSESKIVTMTSRATPRTTTTTATAPMTTTTNKSKKKQIKEWYV